MVLGTEDHFLLEVINEVATDHSIYICLYFHQSTHSHFGSYFVKGTMSVPMELVS